MVKVRNSPGYKARANSYSAADATSHLFFAYLRSMSPGAGKSSGILTLPRSLQQLLDSTTYPPKNALLSNDTTKVVMIVDVVSPTPYALLRRAKNFEYRDDDQGLQQFASYDDPVKALTDECRRVLKAISSANQSQVSNAKTSTSLTDPSWSRFEDIGFGSSLEEEEEEDDGLLGRRVVSAKPMNASARGRGYQDLARPTTPSWADFLSSGFADENNKAPPPMLLPPDKILPPLHATAPRGQSSQSHRRNLDNQNLDPGELASITKVNVDDSFWWVWISSLASEEPTSRKAVFGRCALIETVFPYDKWMVMEEQVKGAAPEPAAGAYIAEKKRTFLGFTTKRGRLTRRGSGSKKSPLSPNPALSAGNRATLAPDQHAKIQQAAAALTRRKEAEEREEQAAQATRRGRMDDNATTKTNSIFTLGPLIKDEASPALQWASQYDKKAIRAKYLGDSLAGRGSRELLGPPQNGLGISRSTSTLSVVSKNKDLPAPPSTNASRPALVERSHSAEPPSAAQAPAQAPAPPVVIEPAPMPVESSVPIDPIATTEAAEVSLPPATPDITEAAPVKHQPAKLRKSIDQQRRSPPEARKRGKTPPGPPPVQKTGGIRRLFGTKRSKSRDSKLQERPESPSGVDEDPAVIAARRALEGKPALPSEGPVSPPLSPGHFQRLTSVKTKPTPPAESKSNTTPVEMPAAAREATPEPPMEPQFYDEAPAPPRTRRDEEYDQLSRVDTNEREHADREFSTFDQGPLTDQPAFAPADTPPREEFLTPGEEAQHNPISVHSGRSARHAESDADEEDGHPLTHQVSPTDRWAQIRKNAAERAARQSEEQTSRSRTETRTDDGETSGEESKCP